MFTGIATVLRFCLFFFSIIFLKYAAARTRHVGFLVNVGHDGFFIPDILVPDYTKTTDNPLCQRGGFLLSYY